MDEFEDLRDEVSHCIKCELSETRHKTVFGNGNRHAGIMLIGEGPGYYEDMAGEAFIGKSGKLLDKILAACGFTREEHIFISNIVKCRPPENRNPTPQERATCLPYLMKQIELINPKIIVLLGATALNGLVDPNARITKVRGQWIEWHGIQVIPTYHPSALLRNPRLKVAAWEDFKNVVEKYRELVDPDFVSPNC